MSDIVYCPPDVDCPCYARLTDEVAKQAARIEKLEEALREIAEVDLDYTSGSGHEGAILTARAALEKST